MANPIHQKASSKKTLIILCSVVLGMLVLSFASVPLYKLFCESTGYGGTPKKDATLPTHAVLNRPMTVRFNTDVAPNLPWRFYPEKKSVDIIPGQTAIMAFKAKNMASNDLAGIATFNVTPAKAGKYFVKVQCFCYGEQVIAAGKEVDLPVYFYIDPTIAEDTSLDDVKTITLSYTYFKANSHEFETALKKLQ
ncbi:MAG: cytochrome c oxidase assembly protein [Alphaproteobacteria bacterium]